MNNRFCYSQLAVATVMLFHLGVTEAKDIDWEALNPEINGATYTNESGECLECHEEHMRTFAMTKHGRSLPQGGCESCHGPMSKHMDAPRRKPALLVTVGPNSSLTAEQQNSICTQCHQGGVQMNWQMSSHAFAENTCVDCHNMMNMEDPVLTRTSQTQVCFTCHKDKRAQMYRRSRHPMKEGKVVCSDCHNPHGSAGPTQLVKNSVNETCYQCHQEKRGPFLVEHQPARENCSYCHDPHGSTQPRMLKVRQPWLCQQCHGEAYHPGDLYDGTGIPINGGAARQLLGKSCTNCHNMVHGSNHPSGQRLSR